MPSMADVLKKAAETSGGVVLTYNPSNSTFSCVVASRHQIMISGAVSSLNIREETIQDRLSDAILETTELVIRNWQKAIRKAK